MNNGAYKSKLGALGVCGCVVEAMHMFPYSAQVRAVFLYLSVSLVHHNTELLFCSIHLVIVHCIIPSTSIAVVLSIIHSVMNISFRWQSGAVGQWRCWPKVTKQTSQD